MNLNNKHFTSCLDGYFLLPSWWIYAFENYLNLNSDPVSLSLKTFLYPTLTVEELNSITNILLYIQERLLFNDNPCKSFSLDFSSYRKHFNSSAAHLFNYERIFQIFPFLSILTEKKENNSSKNNYKLNSIVSSFNLETDKDDLILNIDLSSLGVEAILGYYNPYRLLLNKDSTILDKNPPLLISKSVWVALSTIEQVFFLNMEKAIQYENRWLHFDGIFGLDFFSLSKKISPFFKWKNNSFSTLSSFINKTIKKLIEHGIVAPISDFNYLATDSVESSNLLVWKSSSKEIEVLSNKTLISKCLKINSYFTKQELYKICSILSNKKISEDIFSKIESLLKEVREKYPHFFYPLLEESSNTPISGVWLFIEWSLRNTTNHPFSIKDFIQDPSILSLCKISKNVTISDLILRLENFCTILYGNSYLIDYLKNTALSSFTFKKALTDSNFSKYLDEFLNQNNDITYNRRVDLETKNKEDKIKDKDLNKDRLKDKKINTDDTSISLDKDIGKNLDQTQNKNTDIDSIATHNKIHLDTSTKNIIPSLNSSYDFSNLKKIAIEELNSLRKENSNRYNLLKEKYINSLSEERRQILMDVKNKMSPEVFDTHLRHSLLKYMVDNPASWSSSTSTKKDFY